VSSQEEEMEVFEEETVRVGESCVFALLKTLPWF